MALKYFGKSTGGDGSGGGGGTNVVAAYLPVPDNVEETTTFFYFGWISVPSGGWLIQRQVRENAQTKSLNTGFVDFSTAWASRTTATYV
jgi:hypothetical protein